MREFYIGNACCSLINSCENTNVYKKVNNYYEHYHSYFEFYYIEKGNCHISCKNGGFDVLEGELFLIPPRLYHRISYMSEDIHKTNFFIDIKLPDDNCSVSDYKFYNTFQKLGPTLLKPETSEMKSTIEKISRLLKNSAPDFLIEEKMRAVCHLFLLELFEKLMGGEKIENTPEKTGVPMQEEIIDVFFAYSFMSNSSERKLAEKLHVSPRQLHRIIKKNYNMNYRQKLCEIRMEIATNMLRNTDKTIAEIAEILGYSSSANFSTFIKNYSGKTPSQIRRKV